MTTTNSYRGLQQRMAAHVLHSRVTDPAAHTAPARKAFLVDKFERQVDPDSVLPPSERARRAEHARKAHFMKMAIKSAKARKERAAADVPRPRQAPEETP